MQPATLLRRVSTAATQSNGTGTQSVRGGIPTRSVGTINSWLYLREHDGLRLHGYLERLRFAKRAHKEDREYQFWQEGSHAEMILSEAMMREKLDYIHANPVKRGYVDKPEQWRYSSARN